MSYKGTRNPIYHTTYRELGGLKKLVTVADQIKNMDKTYLLEVDKKLTIDARNKNSCYARYANDYKDDIEKNNAVFRYEKNPDGDPLRDEVWLVATKDIYEDDEIFCQYGAGYWDGFGISHNYPKSKKTVSSKKRKIGK
jgi:hypothetical protein